MSDRISFIRIFGRIRRNTTFGVPLGIASLISFLKNQKMDLIYDFFDTGILPDYKKEILKKYRTEKPIVFAVSSMLRHSDIARDCVKFLKKAFPDIPVVIGGPIVTSLRERIFEIIDTDFAVYKEGEIPLFLLIKGLINKERRFSQIPSLLYREGDKIIFNPEKDSMLKPDEIPLPDLEAINIRQYFTYITPTYLGHRPYIPIITSRGCPYQCIYCHNFFGRIVRKMDKNKIIEYTNQMIKKYGAKDVEIYDDIFNADEDRARFIINGIYNQNKNINFFYPIGFRADILTDSFIEFIGTHNTKYIIFGIETASERLQSLIKKRLNLKKAKENIEKLSKYPILLHGSFMLGFPTEVEEEVKMTINYALNLPIHTAGFLRVTPHPGTELYNLIEQNMQDKILMNLNKLRFYSNDINVSDVDTSTLNKLRRLAFLKFYLRPSQILKIMRVANPQMIFDGFLTFLNILTERHNE